MCSFAVDVPADSADSLVLDCSMSTLDWTDGSVTSNNVIEGKRPLKMEALRAATAIPPAMMRPPRPSVPRGTLGGPPPIPAPRCCIIRRKLCGQKPSWPQGRYLSIGLRPARTGECQSRQALFTHNRGRLCNSDSRAHEPCRRCQQPFDRLNNGCVLEAEKSRWC